MRHFILSVLLMLTGIAAQAQATLSYDPAQTLPLQALQADLTLLRNALEEGHPTLYWYTPKAEMDSLFEDAQKRLNRDMTESEYFAIVNPLVSRINCGHTVMRMSKSYEKHFLSHAKLLPFSVASIENKLYVRNNRSADTTLKRGTELISINGHPVDSLFKEFMQHTAMDGYNQTGKVRYTEVKFATYFYTLVEEADTFNIVRVSKGGDTSAVALPARILKKPSLKAALKKGSGPSVKDATLKLRIMEGDSSIAIMTVNSFSGLITPTFNRFFKQSFKELEEKNIQHLIIDLRDNSGGYSSVALKLYTYLAQSTFRYYDHIEQKKKGYTFNKYMNQRGLMAVSNTFSVRKGKEDHYTVRLKGHKPQKPASRYAYKGQVYMLTSGFTASAAALLTARAHSDKRAVFIGEETGGGYKGCAGGILPYLTLPNSGLRLRFPTMKFCSAVGEHPEGRGTLPDHEVVATWQDFMDLRDVQMDYTLKLIMEKKPRQATTIAPVGNGAF
jgi:C-terminal processing protease CtpA/Prc